MEVLSVKVQGAENRKYIQYFNEKEFNEKLGAYKVIQVAKRMS